MDDEIDPKQFRFVQEENEEIFKKINELKELLIEASDSGVKPDEASVLSSLGLAYFKIENFDLARQYQEKYLALVTELEDEKGKARAHCNLGCISKAMGNFTEAREQFEAAINIGHEDGNNKLLARAYNNLGNIYELAEDLPAALDCHLKRLAIAHQLKDKNGIGKACATLGNLYHVTGELESSIQYYQEMLKILREKLKIQDTLAEESDSGDEDPVDLDMVTMQQMAEAQEKLREEERLKAAASKRRKSVFHNPFLKKDKKNRDEKSASKNKNDAVKKKDK